MDNSGEALRKFRAKFPGYDDLPDDQLASRLLAKHPEYSDIFGNMKTGSPSPEPETPGLFGTSIGENSGWMKAARTGAKMVRQGGKMTSDSFQPQSQSLVVNMLKNTPGTIADIGANLVANAIEPEALLTEGAMKGLQLAAPYVTPAIKATGRWLGATAEAGSGLAHKQPGVLAAATDDPLLQWRPGRSTSQKAYDAAKNESNIIRKQFKLIEKPEDVVRETLNALDESGITTQEALYARKSLDQSKKSWGDEFYRYAREKLDNVAKQDFSGGDAQHAQALKSEALRTVGSINKGGTSSVLRNSLMLGSAPMGYLPGVAAVFSPAAQGAIASGVGVGNKAVKAAVENPAVTGMAATLLNKYKSKPDPKFSKINGKIREEKR